MNSLAPEEIALLRALVKPAIVLLILQRFDRPLTAREIAAILGTDRGTIAGYLRRLVELDLVVRVSYHRGYVLRADGLSFLAKSTKGKNRPDRPVININPPESDPGTLITITIPENDRAENCTDLAEHPRRRDRAARPGTRLPVGQDTPQQAALRQALREAGILEPKRSALLGLSHLTPQVVTGWQKYLRLSKGDRYTTGLLIHVLESGEPPPPESALPPTNPNGHLKSCRCPECQRLRFLICPYCSRYPCECP